MDAYRRFIEQKAKLEMRFIEERMAAAEAALIEIKLCVMEFGFTPDDIFPRDRLRKITKRKARYYDPVSGVTWSGVGREPVWIRGKDRKQFELTDGRVPAQSSEVIDGDDQS